MKIMYVEDNPANISLLQRIARMGGHEVVNYTDGEKCLSNFAKDAPDLVLMDLQLEGRIGGLDVVKQLRERGFKTPIVAVTAYAMVGDRERCIEAGCNSYLSKPLPVAELVELVKDYEAKVAEAGAKPKTVETPQAGQAPKPVAVHEAVTEVVKAIPAEEDTKPAKSAKQEEARSSLNGSAPKADTAT